MASRAFLLCFVATSFAVVWSGDRRHEEQVLAARRDQSGAWAAALLRERRELSRTCLSASDVLTPRSTEIHATGPVAPKQLAEGRYRLIDESGASWDLNVGAAELATLGIERAERSPARVALNAADRRWFLVRIGVSAEETPSVRMSLDDDARRPTRM